MPHDASGKAKYFEGLPIPSSLVLVGGMALCTLLGRIEPGALPIPRTPATESVFNLSAKEGGYRFYSSLSNYLPASSKQTILAALSTGATKAASAAAQAGGADLRTSILSTHASVVPLGTFRVDLAPQLTTLLRNTLGSNGIVQLLSAKQVIDLGRYAVLEGHWIAFLWFFWAMAMVSKTLRVPKP